jgi:cyclophilin family peptidyl-prolyl cis-trans isomerase
MRKLKVTLTVLLLSLMVFNADAQVKKAPVKKKPVAAKKATAFKPPVIKKIPGTRIKITTDSGVIVIRLYDKTPLHRDNFIKLVSDHFYDSLIFHRVIQDFMIQGGDPQSKTAPPGMQLGGGDIGYTIPAEFDTTLIHKKGVLAGARMGDDVNPKKESSGCQFYIVQGKKWTDQELQMVEMQIGHKYTAAQKNIYKTIGGTPFLDMNYTVFGEVESGLKVIDKIARVPKAPGDRPLGDVRMKMEVVKEVEIIR